MQDMIPTIEPLIPGLRRYARGMVRDISLADDLVQDCLERAVSRWHQRKPDRSTKAWLYTILHNIAVDNARRPAHRMRFVAVDDNFQQELSIDSTQEHQLHINDLLNMIAHLPVEQRTILLLIGTENLSYAEAAEVCGVPIGTIMSRLSRGRERLRQLLNENEEQPILRSVT